jgi:hypothetical protein
MSCQAASAQNLKEFYIAPQKHLAERHAAILGKHNPLITKEDLFKFLQINLGLDSSISGPLFCFMNTQQS